MFMRTPWGHIYLSILDSKKKSIHYWVQDEFVSRGVCLGREWEFIFTPARKVRELRRAVQAGEPGDQTPDLFDLPRGGEAEPYQHPRVVRGTFDGSVECIEERAVSFRSESAGDLGGPAGSSQENGEVDSKRRRLR